MRRTGLASALLFATFTFTGCSDDGGAQGATSEADTGGADSTSPVDSSPAMDTAADDTAPIDSSAPDTAIADSASADSASADSASADTAADTAPADTFVCAAPKLTCGGACVDPTTDTNNCGACDKKCATGASCAAGTCACTSGLVVCGASSTSPGTCADTRTDVNNCGACGTTCDTGKSCVASACVAPGTLDTSFGSGSGWVRYQPTSFHNEWYALALNPDDTMMFAGRNQVGGADEDWVVSKLKVDGTFDTTFGTGGSLLISSGAAIGERARGIVRASDGSFYVGGSLFVSGSGFDFAVAKVTSAGALDSTYATSGVAKVVSTGDDVAYGMHLYSDGKVLLVGTSGSGTNASMRIVRLLANGNLDSGFGTGGVFTYGTAGVDDEAWGVAVDSAGAIFVAGFSDNDSAVLKLKSDGTLDTSFATTGAKVLDLSGASRLDQLRKVELGPSGTVVVGGIASNGTNNDFVIARLTAAGALDSTFGTAGKTIVDRAGAGDSLFALRIAPDGRIYFGGGTALLALVGRLTTAGAVDTTFASSGFFTNSFSSFASNVNDIGFDSKGRVVIGGSWAQTNPDYGAARLFP